MGDLVWGKSTFLAGRFLGHPLAIAVYLGTPLPAGRTEELIIPSNATWDSLDELSHRGYISVSVSFSICDLRQTSLLGLGFPDRKAGMVEP